MIRKIFILSLNMAFLLSACDNKPKEIAFETTRVQYDTLRSSVTATGKIEPVTSVEVGTQVSGIVSRLYVDYNSIVRKGQVIAELDRTNLVSELETAQANLASAKSEKAYQESNYKRQKKLYDKGLISADDYEQAELAYIKAANSVRSSQQNVNKAQTNLGYATITSPIDGVVLSKSVEEGQTVAASFNTPTLFTIAQNLQEMRVIANIDEADIGGVANGQRVVFTVDAYPHDQFEGFVTQVRQEAITTSNVVTYEVVISAPNEHLKLKPGLTANVTIYTIERQGVLCVRSKALRFSPTQNELGPSMKLVDCQGKNKVWVKDGKELKAIAIGIGETDGTRTEILKGVNAGQEIVTGINAEKEVGKDNASEKQRNPFLPGPPQKNKKK